MQEESQKRQPKEKISRKEWSPGLNAVERLVDDMPLDFIQSSLNGLVCEDVILLWVGQTSYRR